PDDPNSELITHVKPGDDLSRFIQNKKSNAGRGGMESKYSIAQEVNNAGITVIIANGKRNNVLTDLLIEHKTIPCTIFENHQ
ncbi:MAG: glutamate 5-kinase, partial [Bacteroidaceae bacterium]|nr:glutamate 5-kinase [Bacteroidaceae bacterium]